MFRRSLLHDEDVELFPPSRSKLCWVAVDPQAAWEIASAFLPPCCEPSNWHFVAAASLRSVMALSFEIAAAFGFCIHVDGTCQSSLSDER